MYFCVGFGAENRSQTYLSMHFTTKPHFQLKWSYFENCNIFEQYIPDLQHSKGLFKSVTVLSFSSLNPLNYSLVLSDSLDVSLKARDNLASANPLLAHYLRHIILTHGLILALQTNLFSFPHNGFTSQKNCPLLNSRFLGFFCPVYFKMSQMTAS